MSFAIPNIKSGTVFEYSYTKVSDYLYNLTDWVIQKDIPVAYSQLKYTIPEYFNYQANQLGNSYNVGGSRIRRKKPFPIPLAPSELLVVKNLLSPRLVLHPKRGHLPPIALSLPLACQTYCQSKKSHS